jgi:hypothetical protein
VERKVNILRQRFQGGYITREQLQNELRGLMILDDEGHWWMIGMESNRWYYFDGRDWVPGIPPGQDESIRGSVVPTETSVQQVVTEPEPGVIATPHIEIDEDGMPLPARVPQEDPGATIVSASTPFMEPMRRSEAPTLPKGRRVDSGEGEIIAQPGPADQLTQPTRAEPLPGAAQPTLRSEPVRAAGPTRHPGSV